MGGWSEGRAAPSGGPEEVSDYTGVDFRSEWRGRERVSELEREIVRRSLGSTTNGRVLEIGVGFGRLSEAIRRVAGSYVGVDLNPVELGRVAASAGRPPAGGPAPAFVEANAMRMPFRDGAFSAIVVIRVFHHIGRPEAFLRELVRIMVPGGRLLLQYNPKPTIGTLAMDLRQGLRHSAPPRPSVTWSGQGLVRVTGERFPIFVLTAKAVRSMIEAAGLRPLSERGTGAERLQRWFPSLWQRALPPVGPLGALLPSRFLLCERPPTHGPLPEVAASWLACPRCRTPIDEEANSSRWARSCPACGFPVESDGSVLHARYVPSGE